MLHEKSYNFYVIQHFCTHPKTGSDTRKDVRSSKEHCLSQSDNVTILDCREVEEILLTHMNLQLTDICLRRRNSKQALSLVEIGVCSEVSRKQPKDKRYLFSGDLLELLQNTSVKIELLTGSTRLKDRKVIHEALQNGELNILIGTHALLEEKVQFKNLGIAIIDEQHRFGVAQRSKLWEKNKTPPHVLVMTATPIPRTLAMSIYVFLPDSDRNDGNWRRAPVPQDQMHGPFHKSGIPLRLFFQRFQPLWI